MGKSKEEKTRRVSGRRCWIFIGMVRVVISVSEFKDLGCDRTLRALFAGVDCLCQVRQDKRAAKEKRREEARMREVSNTKYFSSQTKGLSLAFSGGGNTNIAFRLLFASCSSLLGCP